MAMGPCFVFCFLFHSPLSNIHGAIGLQPAAAAVKGAEALKCCWFGLADVVSPSQSLDLGMLRACLGIP